MASFGIPECSHPTLGLRERKKARTRAAIRTQAIRMFAERGYAATTVEQIAEAADISPSTFFRYFPTKEAVIVTDENDPQVLEVFQAQPAEVSPVRAFRNAVQAVTRTITPQELEQEKQRAMLIRTVPELRSAMVLQYGLSVGELAGMIARRLGRSADDFRIRTLAGAMIGVAMSVTLEAWDADAPALELSELKKRLDQAMELLELGLPL